MNFLFKIPVTIILVFGICSFFASTAHAEVNKNLKSSPSQSPSITQSASPSSTATPVQATSGFLQVDPSPSAKSISDLVPEPSTGTLAEQFYAGKDWSHYTLSGANPAFKSGEQTISLPIEEPTLGIAKALNSAAKTFISATLWLCQEILAFKLGTYLVPIAKSVGSALHQQILGPIRLGDAAMGITTLLIGIKIALGHRQRALKDGVIAFLIIGLGYLGMSLPYGFLCSSISISATISHFLLSVGLAGGGITDSANNISSICSETFQTDIANVFSPIEAKVFEVFVSEPFFVLQWGGVEGKCRELAEGIVQTGYFGNSAEPRHLMAISGCESAEAFNRSNSIDRTIFSGLHFMTVATFCAGLISLLLPVVIAQGVTVILLISAPFIWTMGFIPNIGFPLLVNWFMYGVKAFLSLILYTALLGLILGLLAVMPVEDHLLLSMSLPTCAVISLAAVRIYKWDKSF